MQFKSNQFIKYVLRGHLNYTYLCNKHDNVLQYFNKFYNSTRTWYIYSLKYPFRMSAISIRIPTEITWLMDNELTKFPYDFNA